MIVGYHCYQLIQIFNKYPLIKVKSVHNEITGDHQCGFRRNRSTIDQIFCFRQILEKNWSIMGLQDFKKTYDSVRGTIVQYSLRAWGTQSIN
jgi:hypothetical protein